MNAFSVENPHDGKTFENYTRFERGVEVGVVTIFILRLFVPHEFDMFSIEGFLKYTLKYAPSLNFVVKLVMFIFTNIIVLSRTESFKFQLDTGEILPRLNSPF